MLDMLNWQRQIKEAVDPANVLGAGNQGFDQGDGDGDA